jgi:hypothetical protein
MVISNTGGWTVEGVKAEGREEGKSMPCPQGRKVALLFINRLWLEPSLHTNVARRSMEGEGVRRVPSSSAQ